MDPHIKDLVDFDQEYLNRQKPYNKQSIIVLKILWTTSGQFWKPTCDASTSVIVPQRQERKIVDKTNDRTSYFGPRTYLFVEKLHASHPVTINDTNASIKFARNVDEEQRDEDINKESRIRGAIDDLEGVENRCNMTSPTVKVITVHINETNRSNFMLMIFLVWEMCEKGIRTLYYHPYRKLFKDSKRQDHIIFPLTVKMFNEGDDLNLHTKGIRGSRTGGKDKTKILFCRLHNRLSENTQYETSRLACLLMKNGNPLWDTLKLSKAVIFTNRIVKSVPRVKKSKLPKKRTKVDLPPNEPAGHKNYSPLARNVNNETLPNGTLVFSNSTITNLLNHHNTNNDYQNTTHNCLHFGSTDPNFVDQQKASDVSQPREISTRTSQATDDAAISGILSQGLPVCWGTNNTGQCGSINDKIISQPTSGDFSSDEIRQYLERLEQQEQSKLNLKNIFDDVFMIN
ncbi:unnamed protein product [Adineta steineri]|uniref:Uncharacterized protein n=1 Tax=Adineta steineri TaxID=433720 RepID=A0A814DAK8_9BILA|nr:unnamed protein product [Adineta steineri]CAF0973013.1 unnamed protein product [Adineta steineri]CAF4100377.1 unnamed protein product [Adineta steineri]CAF4135880.1 unnamed protein product [Adineta steineri]